MSQKYVIFLKKSKQKAKHIPRVNVKYLNISEPSQLADTMTTAC